MKINIHYTLFIFFLISFFCGLLFECVLMFIILLCHEFGHLYFLKRYKREIFNITFYPFGGVIKHSNNYNNTLKEDFLISVGGVLVNIVLLFLFQLLHMNLCLLINYGILLFNIIPIFPLDGFKIIKCIVSSLFNYKRSIYISYILSFIFIIVLFISNIIYIKSYYVFFIIVALININIKNIFNINKEYKLFLTTKYIYPNHTLKKKYNKKISNPINNIYYGKYNIFTIDNITISEDIILNNFFRNNN